jgi:hypothetical protein
MATLQRSLTAFLFFLASLGLTACGGSSNSGPTAVDSGSPNSDSDPGSGGTGGSPVCTVDCITGVTYYVSNAGNDDKSGTSPDDAWKTIDRVNRQAFSPGDGILFRRGDTWRETLHLNSSGTTDQWIVYGAYGDGDKPRILGSEQAVGWTQAAPDIWQSATAVENPYAGGYSNAEVFFEEIAGTTSWGRKRNYDNSFVDMVREYDWSWNAGTLYVYASSDPATRYRTVEVPQRDGIVQFPNIDGSTVLADDYVQYVTLDNLDLRYSRRWGVWAGYNEIEAKGFRVVNCTVGDIGVKGGSSAYGIADWHSDSLFQNNTIHDCGRRGISLNTYTSYTPGLTVRNVVIDRNLFYNGYHTTSVDISSLPGLGHTFAHITFSNNIVDDSGRHSSDINDGCAAGSCTSNAVYISSESGNHYSDFTIHHNVILGATSRAVLIQGPLDKVYFYHNSIYGSHPDANPYGLVVFSDVTNIDMRNNIIYGVLPASAEARCVLDENTSTFAVRDYNLYYQDDPNQPFTGSENGAGGWDTFMSEWDTWRAASGFEASSPQPQDPLFTDPSADDLSLSAASAAVDAGVLIPGINDDYQGNAPDLGAIESPHTSP